MASQRPSIEINKELRKALADFENPAGHAAADAKLNPHLLEAAREHEEIRRRSKEAGNNRVYR